MNLSEYQKQTKITAIYPDIGRNMLYPTLGLMGECGEICEKIKKLIRDDNNIITTERKKTIAMELGDIMWYVATICSEIMAEIDMLYIMGGYRAAEHVRNFDLPRIAIHLFCLSAEVAKSVEQWYYSHNRNHERKYPYYVNITSGLSSILQCIKAIAYQACGLSIEEICDLNIEKLLSRKNRNTLRGDGDSR